MRFLLVIGALLAGSASADDGARLRDREAELEALKAEIATISRRVTADQKARSGAAAELTRTEQRIAALRAALATLAQDIARQESRVAEQQAEQARLDRRLSAQRAALGSQLRAAYIIGRNARTRLVLSQQDPARASRLMQYFGYLHRDRSQAIHHLDEATTAAATRAAALARDLRDLGSLRQSREDTLAGVEAQGQRRRKLLEQLAREIRGGERELERLRAQQQQLEQLIDGLRQASRRHAPLKPGTPFAAQRGRLQRPLNGKVLARFRQAKTGGSRWNGLWLAAAAGTPVQAVADGRVVYVGWMHQLGLLLVVDHGDGYFSLYGHAGASTRQVGETVRAGDQIGIAGNTGGHRQDGVYLEIRKGRTALNPEEWLGR